MGQKEAAKQKRQETEQMDCIYEKKHNNICERLEESKTAVFKCSQMKGNVNFGCMVDQTRLLCKVVRYRHPNQK